MLLDKDIILKTIHEIAMQGRTLDIDTSFKLIELINNEQEWVIVFLDL